MRTVHSVINTSPPHLLKDIILIDDFSNTKEILQDIEPYIKRWNGIVKLFRTSKREGLVQARVIGAEKAAGDVIVVLGKICLVDISL
jgi:polypeptide N-acetylgalactosaminyltransferase